MNQPTYCPHTHAQLEQGTWYCAACGHQWPDRLVQDYRAHGWSDSAAMELAGTVVKEKEQ